MSASPVDPEQLAPVGSGTPVNYAVGFGSAFVVDQNGFVRSGTLTVDGPFLEIAGPKHLPALHRLVITLGALILWWLLFGFGIFSILIVLTLVHYFGAKQTTMRWARPQISEITRSGKIITFSVPGSGARPKKAVLRATDSGTATAIETRMAEMPSELPLLQSNPPLVPSAESEASFVAVEHQAEIVLSPSSTISPDAHSHDTATRSVGERLHAIEQLREQGLVSAEAYEAKRRAILENI